jgi:predicted DNA-binding transcriptional regulator YafY
LATVNRTDRLYAIAAELRAAGTRGRTADWLAGRFEVSARTIKRDVDALQQAGEPIWAQSGPGGGYVLDSAAASMPPVALSAPEATAVALALATAVGLPFLSDGRSALRKILDVMPAVERDRATELASRLWVRAEDIPPRPPVARVIEKSIRRRVVLVLDYVDGRGKRTARRVVEPMALARTGGRWYLLAWCRTRRAGRWFRLDRTTAAVPTGEEAKARDLREVFGEPPADAHPLSW